MKKVFFKVLLAASCALVILVILCIIQNDRSTWTAWYRVSVALREARSVTLVEFVGKTDLARRTATSEEISRLRKAISRWWYPFFGGGFLCYNSHHRIEIVRTDGSALECFVCFECETFITDDATIPTASLPPHIYKPLASFFASVGMKPRPEVYRQLELVQLAAEEKKPDGP